MASIPLPTPDRPLRLGTRASPLAMAQANMAAAALIAAYGIAPEAIEIVPMTATGDKIQDRALYAAVAEQIESEKSKIKSAIAETQTLFNALMAEYFEE